MTTIIPDQPLPRRTESGMHTRAVNAAAGVLQAAMEQGRQLPVSLAIALDSARLLNSPEHAAELDRLRARLGEVHRVPQDNVTSAEVRLGQYARPPRTFASDTERALFEIACGLRDALEETRDQRNSARLRVLALEEQRDRRRARMVALQNDAMDMRGSLSPNGENRKVPFPLGETLTPAVDWLIARIAELEAERHTTNEALDDAVRALREQQAAPTTVYRAEHPDSGIVLGHYGTEAAARAHCEATERRSWPEGTTLVFGWIRDALPEDDENGIAELVVTAGQTEESTTGYIVTALELDSEYDPDGDE